ncbi:MAG TPA: TetR/AcrR family transcriptional regulator [Acidimicrobiia bacterium]|nr:TetR/AcrR family transcriptional regulator [Acidimicrobiia bacterium]
MAAPPIAGSGKPAKSRASTRTSVRKTLGEDEIVAAALEIIAESGVDALTMRHLSAKLGVALGATYHHVPNKHALLVLVTNELYSRITIPARESDDCLGQIRQMMINLTAVMQQYPGLAAYMTRHPDEVPMVKVNQVVQGALADAGLQGEAMARAVTALSLYVTGAILSGYTTSAQPAAGRGRRADSRFAGSLDIVLAGIAAEVERQAR